MLVIVLGIIVLTSNYHKIPMMERLLLLMVNILIIPFMDEDTETEGAEWPPPDHPALRRELKWTVLDPCSFKLI